MCSNGSLLQMMFFRRISVEELEEGSFLGGGGLEEFDGRFEVDEEVEEAIFW